MFTFEMLIKYQYTVHLSDCQGQSLRQDSKREADNNKFKKLKTSLAVLICRKKSKQMNIIDEGGYILQIRVTPQKKKRLLRG